VDLFWYAYAAAVEVAAYSFRETLFCMIAAAVPCNSHFQPLQLVPIYTCSMLIRLKVKVL
jgi:hypothetical protein